jgi:hypothetical protein
MAVAPVAINNNKIDPVNVVIRDNQRVMRTFQKSDSPILEGIEIYHTLVPPHMPLNWITPRRQGLKLRVRTGA